MGRVPNTPPRRTSDGPGFVVDAFSTLARWLSRAPHDSSARALAQVASAHNYGELFWAMRDLGEALRRNAFTALNTSYGHPSVPNERAVAHFSHLTILSEVARQCGLHVFFAPEPVAQRAELIDPRRRVTLLAWLHTYPDTRVPDLCLRSTVHEDALHFQAACVIGWWLQERPHFEGPGQPGGSVLLPDHTLDLHFSPMLHSFAKGLLLLDDLCPETLGCHCNRIIHSLNAAPEAHPQATGAYSLAQLRRGASPTTHAHVYNTRPLRRDTWRPGG
jgi:hypothetical protein